MTVHNQPCTPLELCINTTIHCRCSSKGGNNYIAVHKAVMYIHYI